MKLVAAARSTSAPRLVKAGGVIVAAVGLMALGSVSSVSAQTVNNAQTLSQPLNGNGFSNADGSADPFSSRGGNQSSGVMNLIHRALQGQSKGADEFNAEQQQSLDSEAAQFRAKQQTLLQQGTAAPAVPTVAPLPATK
jgi:hypothetical protein